MASLKLFLPQLAAVLQVNPHTLYERQRVLMREGLLPVVPGRGPGSGVHVSPKSVATLLVSILATDALVQAGADTRKLARAKQNENRCPLTGETRFQNALERLLSVESLAESTLRIEVERMGLTARIGFKSADDRLVISEFGGKFQETGMNLRITATVPGWGTEIIAKDLADIAANAPLRNHKPFRESAK